MGGGEKPLRLLLGEIGAPHGLRGEVRLRSFTQDPADIAGYGPLEDEAGSARFEIKSLRPGPKGALIAKFKGVDDRNAAERLNRTGLYVARDRLPDAEEDEFYYSDLVGLAAVSPEGEALGRIAAVHNFGAGDILELAPIGGGPTELVPFTFETVPEIEIGSGRIVMLLPAVLEAAAPEGAVEDGEQ